MSGKAPCSIDIKQDLLAENYKQKTVEHTQSFGVSLFPSEDWAQVCTPHVVLDSRNLPLKSLNSCLTNRNSLIRKVPLLEIRN